VARDFIFTGIQKGNKGFRLVQQTNYHVHSMDRVEYLEKGFFHVNALLIL